MPATYKAKIRFGPTYYQVTDWYDSFEEYPIPVPVRYERRNKKTTPYHDQFRMFKSTYHFNTGPDSRLKDKS